VDAVAEKANVTKKDADTNLRSAIDTIVASIAEVEKVTLVDSIQNSV
jgi:DNA-binding protein HU-beta